MCKRQRTAQMDWVATSDNQIPKMRTASLTSVFSSRRIKGKPRQEKAELRLGKAVTQRQFKVQSRSRLLLTKLAYNPAPLKDYTVLSFVTQQQTFSKSPCSIKQQQQIKFEIDTTLVRGSLLSHRMSPHRDRRSLQRLCQVAKKMGRGQDENQTCVPHLSATHPGRTPEGRGH